MFNYRFQESKENDFFLLEFFELLKCHWERLQHQLYLDWLNWLVYRGERLVHPVTDILEVNSTGLEKKLLSQVLGLVEHKKGQDVMYTSGS